jgi:hypothetical protein
MWLRENSKTSCPAPQPTHVEFFRPHPSSPSWELPDRKIVANKKAGVEDWQLSNATQEVKLNPPKIKNYRLKGKERVGERKRGREGERKERERERERGEKRDWFINKAVRTPTVFRKPASWSGTNFNLPIKFYLRVLVSLIYQMGEEDRTQGLLRGSSSTIIQILVKKTKTVWVFEQDHECISGSSL